MSPPFFSILVRPTVATEPSEKNKKEITRLVGLEADRFNTYDSDKIWSGGLWGFPER